MGGTEGDHSRDLYRVLGVEPTATQEEIRLAARRLLAQFHPDKNPHDPDAALRFKRVGAAYDVLRNEQKRESYDALTHPIEERDGRLRSPARSSVPPFHAAAARVRPPSSSPPPKPQYVTVPLRRFPGSLVVVAGALLVFVGIRQLRSALDAPVPATTTTTAATARRTGSVYDEPRRPAPNVRIDPCGGDAFCRCNLATRCNACLLECVETSRSSDDACANHCLTTGDSKQEQDQTKQAQQEQGTRAH